MIQGGNYFAFIDSQNVNLSILRQGWKLDFKKFFVYLKEKYKIRQAFLFIGYIQNNRKMYYFLKNCGYTLIFKPTLSLADNKTKGNVDTELVLHTMIQYRNFDQAMIISGDGDFYCLAEYLQDNNKLHHILVPNSNRYSALLKRFEEKVDFMNLLKTRLEYKKSP